MQDSRSRLKFPLPQRAGFKTLAYFPFKPACRIQDPRLLSFQTSVQDSRSSPKLPSKSACRIQDPRLNSLYPSVQDSRSSPGLPKIPLCHCSPKIYTRDVTTLCGHFINENCYNVIIKFNINHFNLIL